MCAFETSKLFNFWYLLFMDFLFHIYFKEPDMCANQTPYTFRGKNCIGSRSVWNELNGHLTRYNLETADHINVFNNLAVKENAYNGVGIMSLFIKEKVWSYAIDLQQSNNQDHCKISVNENPTYLLHWDWVTRALKLLLMTCSKQYTFSGRWVVNSYFFIGWICRGATWL